MMERHGYLEGVSEDMPDIFHKLQQIFEENIFELWNQPEEKKCKLLYMMTDAIECFLVFEEATITGKYEKDNEAYIDGTLLYDKEGYMLIVHQGKENVFTIRFQKLVMEKRLYSYHDIAHFWIPKHEELRQINYWIGLIYEKYHYVGQETCNQYEKELLSFYEFAPLREFICVPWENEEKFDSTEKGIESFLALAKEAEDDRMEKAIRKYAKKKSLYYKWKIKQMLQMKNHDKMIFLLINKIKNASKTYISPLFGEKKDEEIANARKKITELISGKNDVYLLEERSFSIGEEFYYKFHVLKWKKKCIYRKVMVKTYTYDKV